MTRMDRGAQDPAQDPERTVVSLKAGATRTAILEQAAALFATKGFDGTSLSDIAAAAGLTRPAVYHYFGSKEELLAGLIAEMSSGAADRMEEIRRDSSIDATTKLRRITEDIVRDRIERPDQFRLLERSEASLPEPVATEHRMARRNILNAIKSVIAEGVLAGEFRTCDERIGALSLLGMCNWVAWWYRADGDSDAGAVISAMASNAVAMFARPTARTPSRSGVDGALALVREDLDFLERVIASRSRKRR
ncbi:MAG: TetR family transcriptional regulator [Pseudonocardiales bacterium]|nr:TetR family transcriptional regulator [Pseudonocardiales bacterium]